MYTVMVAAMGQKVVAIDAMSDNLMYMRKSLELGDRTEQVQILNAAIR